MGECRTCRWWDAHSSSMKKGTCRIETRHRYGRVPMPDGSYALWDSFDEATTGPRDTCAAWNTPPSAPSQKGERDGR